MTLECGRADLFPGAPAQRRTDPIDAAIPVQIVATSGAINCIVSYIARPDETTPPGVFRYNEISLELSLDERKRSCA